MKSVVVLIIWQVLLCQTAARSNEKSAFFANLSGDRYWLAHKDNNQALYRIIVNEAISQLDERANNISKFETAADWKAHQEKVRNALCGSLAKFSKTPLNSRTTGVLERDDFTVEKVVFESQPGFYLTAGLFLPKKRTKPAPAVIYCCGHTELGFRSETYQKVILNLVDKGFIVLAFDPIGQGERLQYVDLEKGTSRIGGSTREHSYAGVQMLLAGASLSDYFIWDGIRVVDYLETRPEVDMERIGITGRSGGGTQAALIAACDERIYAAAPENYITSFRRLLQSIGPQDAEQNPWQAIFNEMDHADFLHIRAPKPALILTTTNDFFSIQGARETFEEVKRSYNAFGEPSNLQMVEDGGGHESTLKNRQALYAFFQRHLNVPGDLSEREIEPFTVEELRVTPKGQVAASFQGETVYSINRKFFNSAKAKASAKEIKALDFVKIDLGRKLTSGVYTGKFEDDGMQVDKYFLENDRRDYALPVFAIKKANSESDKVIVWFHPEGKLALLDEPLLPPLLDKGYLVVAADLPGVGELHDPRFTGDSVIGGIPFNYTFGANLIGKSVPGIQAEATDLLIQFIEEDSRFSAVEKCVIAQGSAASSFLLYASNRKGLDKVYFYKFPEPFGNLIEEKYYNPDVAFHVAPGTLPQHDLEQLIEQLRSGGAQISLNMQSIDQSSGLTTIANDVDDFFRK